MTSAIDKQIIQSLELLGHDEKKSLLAVIKSFINLKDGNTGYTMEDYNAELNEAEQEYQKGNTISHEELKQQIKNW